ncbi:receptor-like protein EIX2 [Rhodamnia argentea]|uniref:Receptor-like protein EIX2 n=1 Tax=Rhodamnia argentea TaxID=178133 RepID=A0A8B8P7E2_9MYRT|nr:receptor-like protein EIX2 [Rhodamnia argentea]
MGRFCFQVLALVTLLLILDDLPVCFCRNSTSMCVEHERKALLQLRQILSDPHGSLSSWKGEDCCRWKGVTCDRLYAHVIELQLLPEVARVDYGYVLPDRILSVAGKLNSSLLNLRYLKCLDLSGINFEGERIPAFLGSMKQLRYLDLSFGNFHGTVPQELGNLTKLEVLDLHDYYGNLVVDDTRWISHLQSLNYLDMSFLKIARARDLMHMIGMLPSLSHLSLSVCGLLNYHLSANSTSLVHLQYLDLSYNFLKGPIANVVFQNMTSLQHLDLSGNSFGSSIPMWFDKLPSLVHLNLEYNLFHSIEGGLFSFLKSKKYLKSLYLGYNQLGGEISTSQGNSSMVIANSLVGTLDLSHNQLNGTIPSSLGELSSLAWLDLSCNQFSGHIPASLGHLRALQELHLSSNHLSGTIPDDFGKLSHLSVLSLYINSLGGVISEIHFSNLTRLKYLHISANNNLTFKAEHGWIPPFQLNFIRMDSCKFRNTFPLWMRTQVEVQVISLSNASIFGALPKWFGNMTFREFNLSHNQITGPLPSMSSECSVLDLSHNFISGPLPTNISGMNLAFLYLNDNHINGTLPSSLCEGGFFNLNLGNNSLSGSIPNCWEGFRLFHLTLSFNNLSGVIPSSIGSSHQLSTLHLNGNHLNGELPLNLSHCTTLIVLDLGENNFSGSIPTWLSKSFDLLMILRLRENSFTGSIPSQLCSLPRLQILDLAANNLTGTIPRCLGYMKGMKYFNRDNIPEFVAPSPIYIGSSPSASPLPAIANPFFDSNQEHVVEIMKGRHNEYTKIDLLLAVNLDLSSNHLNGLIPEEFAFLSGLHGLNLSHNLLSGGIPIGIGDMKSLESLDLSSNLLSGMIPQGISALTYLAYLNLSHNNFIGPIPRGKQIQTLNDPSIYADNPLLCGDPLQKKCPYAEAPQAWEEDNIEEGKLEKVMFYLVIMLGFATGFWGVVGGLVYKKNWRHAYFNYADRKIDMAYVIVAVKVAELRRRLRRA